MRNSNCCILWNSVVRNPWIKMHNFSNIKQSKAKMMWVRRLLIAVSIAMLLYIVNRFWLKHLKVPYIDYLLKNHFNDFIGGFVFPAYVNLVLVLSGRNPINNFGVLVLFMLGVSVIWEFVFPQFLSYSTSDILDVVAYMLGTLLYYFVMKKSNDIICKHR